MTPDVCLGLFWNTLLLSRSILYSNGSVTVEKQKAMASAGNKYLGTGERLFCFRRIRLCLDWGFDPITAITGVPLMESKEQIGRAAA